MSTCRTTEEVKSLLQTTKGFDSEQTATFYDNWAPTYEQDIRTLTYRSHNLAVDFLQENFSGNPEDVQVLDVACGSGHVAKLMVDLGFKNFVGVDGSKGMLDEAAKTGLYQELKWALLGTTPLPAETGTFDVVILAGGLGKGFVPVSTVRELCAAAKPGGLICMSVGVHSCTSGVFMVELDRELDLMKEEGLWTLVGVRHSERYMEDPYLKPGEGEEQFIRGTAYLYQKSTQ